MVVDIVVVVFDARVVAHQAPDGEHRFGRAAVPSPTRTGGAVVARTTGGRCRISLAGRMCAQVHDYGSTGVDYAAMVARFRDDHRGSPRINRQTFGMFFRLVRHCPFVL